MDKYDFTIIGGGPIGLYAAVTAAERGATCSIIDSRFHLGGVMMAAYPDKNVLNFPGIPVIKGRDLINDMVNKTRSHGVAFHLGEYIDSITMQGKDTLLIKSSKGEYRSSLLIIAAGLKVYFSSLTDSIRIENWDGSGVAENWPSTDIVKDKRIAIICGNSREIIIPANIRDAAREIIILINHNSSPECTGIDSENIFKNPWALESITGNGAPKSISLFNHSTGQTLSIDVDFIIGFFDNQARQTLYSNLGIKMMGQQIEVDQKMQTSLKRVFAIGDIAWYPGKVMLLSSGIHEARVAVKNGFKIK